VKIIETRGGKRRKEPVPGRDSGIPDPGAVSFRTRDGSRLCHQMSGYQQAVPGFMQGIIPHMSKKPMLL
jgi:hypothetical protein